MLAPYNSATPAKAGAHRGDGSRPSPGRQRQKTRHLKHLNASEIQTDILRLLAAHRGRRCYLSPAKPPPYPSPHAQGCPGNFSCKSNELSPFISPPTRLARTCSAHPRLFSDARRRGWPGQARPRRVIRPISVLFDHEVFPGQPCRRRGREWEGLVPFLREEELKLCFVALLSHCGRGWRPPDRGPGETGEGYSAAARTGAFRGLRRRWRPGCLRRSRDFACPRGARRREG